MKQFKSAYAKLNPQQRQAVDQIDGPVMVLAGPGTGKTQTIALRIANILLKTDTPPSAILALTFTDAAAQAMHQRLASLIGETAYQVRISTFHSFCLDIIQAHPDEFPNYSQTSLITDIQKITLIQQILDQSDFRFIRPLNTPYLYLSDLLKNISLLKKEGIKPDNLALHLDQAEQELQQLQDELSQTELTKRRKYLAKNRELLTVYRQYQAKLEQLNQFDYDDLIQFVVDRFQANSDLLAEYQELYHYFLVDEYQDTNSAQNRLLHLLTSFWQDKANLFVVGDPNQSIYRFQGASLENTLSFLDRFPQAKRIQLQTNYRSPQPLLDLAHHFISHNQTSNQAKLKAVKPVSIQPPVQIVEAPNSQLEIFFILNKIQQLLDSGVSPHQIALIFRTNQDLRFVASFLKKANLPYTTQGGGNLLQDPLIVKLIKLFQVIDHLSSHPDDLDLFTLLNYDFFQLDSLDLLQLSHQAVTQRTSFFEIVNLFVQDQLPDLHLRQPDKLKHVFQQLFRWHQLAHNQTLVEFFEIVLTESGLLSWLLNQPNSYTQLLKLNSLFASIKQMDYAQPQLTLADFLRNLDILNQFHLPLKEVQFNFASQAITLTTAHSAKGLEWDYVFIYRLVHKRWDHAPQRNLFHLPTNLISHMNPDQLDQLEEERRLFYVALTRAKTQAFLTYSLSYLDNFNSKATLPSQFIAELGQHPQLQFISLEPQSKAIATHLTNLFKPSQPPAEILTSAEENFLTSLVQNFKLSPTALNTYLYCSYLFKLNNLLRIPRAKKPHLAFGTAIHKALEDFFNQFNRSQTLPDKAFLLLAFQRALDQELLSPTDYQQRLTKGKEILSDYYDFHQADFRPSLYTEKKFAHLFLDDIELTGKVDRIDWFDQTKNLVSLIDYKTGTPKTKGYILGKTKNSLGELKRQLVFYQLLIELDRHFPFEVAQTTLDFVQAPHQSRKSGQHSLTITSEDVDQLKQLIRQTMAKIRQLEFPRTQDLSRCAKCELKDHCWPDGLPQS